MSDYPVFKRKGAVGRQCYEPRCPALVTETGKHYCTAHQHLEKEKRFTRARPASSLGLYSTRAWKDAREAALARDKYLCAACGGTANTVHHLTPAKQDSRLWLAMSNLQSLCANCHDKVSQAEGVNLRRSPPAPQR